MPNWATFVTFVLGSASCLLYQKYWSDSRADWTTLRPIYSSRFHVNVMWLGNGDIEIVVR